MLGAAEILANLAVEPEEVEEIIALECPVMLADPVDLLADERLDDRRRDVGVL